DQRCELGRAELWRLTSLAGLWAGLADQRLVSLRRLGHDLGELVPADALERVFALRVRRDLGHRAAGEHRGQAALHQWIALFGMFVGDLARQPVFALFARLLPQADQQPFAFHPLAFEREVEVSLVDILPALAFDRLPRPAIPKHHGAAAILALRDDAFEVGLGHRMVFGPHRQPLDVGIGRGSLGHRPRLQDPIGFQAEIPMQPRRVVLLDDEAVAALARRALARRLRGLPEVALLVVFGERIGPAHSVKSSSGKYRRSMSPRIVSITIEMMAPISTSGHCPAPQAMPIIAVSQRCAAVVRFFTLPLLKTTRPAPMMPMKDPVAS